MITATWKINGLFKADAQLVASEIALLGDEVTPEQIVDAARDETTELHKCFEWDNEIAAEKWRKQQARMLMCYLVIKEDKEAAYPVRVFHKTDSGGYKQSEMIFRNDNEYQKLLQRAYSELHAFKLKYSRLSELSEILALID